MLRKEFVDAYYEIAKSSLKLIDNKKAYYPNFKKAFQKRILK